MPRLGRLVEFDLRRHFVFLSLFHLLPLRLRGLVVPAVPPTPLCFRVSLFSTLPSVVCQLALSREPLRRCARIRQRLYLADVVGLGCRSFSLHFLSLLAVFTTVAHFM